MRNIALVTVWALVAGFAAVSCGEAYVDTADYAQPNTQALEESGGRIEALTGDPLFCPTGPLVSDTSPAAADADDDSALSLEETDAAVRARDRIDTSLEVREFGADHLMLYGRLHNGYRCDWRGQAFLEQEGPFGLKTIVRVRLLIPAGRTVAGTIIVPRPPSGQLHQFFLRAYHSNGGDRQLFYNCLLSEADGDPGVCHVVAEVNTGELELADEVIEASFEEESDTDTSPDALLACDEIDATDVAVRPPMYVDIRLRARDGRIDITTAWQNLSERSLRNDLYVDVTGPGGGVKVVRRDQGVLFDPGVGLCTLDQVRQPGMPGIYVFSANAFRRDGSAQARYYSVATTEITAVCNEDVCELIDPQDWRAELPLFGRSEIHMESAAFSEFTRVWLEYQGRRFDITEYCEIEQGPILAETEPDLAAGRNHIRIKFNSFDLPIPRDTWGLYTIELFPMPPMPCGKWSDRLWILTNALPTCDPTSVSADGC